MKNMNQGLDSLPKLEPRYSCTRHECLWPHHYFQAYTPNTTTF